MDCFKIEWTIPCRVTVAQDYVPTYLSGVYAICRTGTKIVKEIQYIGQTKDFPERLRDHTQGWSHGLTPNQMKYLSVCFGIIHPLQDSPSDDLTQEGIRNDVESLLINTIKPPGNAPQTKMGYKGRPILVINITTLKLIDKVMSSNHKLPELLVILEYGLISSFSSSF